MTTVYNTLNLPAQAVASEAQVKIQVFASTEVDHSPAWVGSTEIIGTQYPTVDNTGRWEIGLDPNDHLIPRGTAYRVTERHPSWPASVIYYIHVPATGGPYATADITTDQPTAEGLLSWRESDVAELQPLHGIV